MAVSARHRPTCDIIDGLNEQIGGHRQGGGAAAVPQSVAVQRAIVML
jgi:hypothetical protein